MKMSVVSKEYQELNKEIFALQEGWKSMLAPEAVQVKIESNTIVTGIPLVSFMSFDLNIPLYLQWIEELQTLLVKNQEDLAGKMESVNEIMNEEIALRWFEEAISINQPYFAGFAAENGMDQWIPQFLAETALRPYLQLAAEKAQPYISAKKAGSGCPVCGEPARFAQLEEEGKKVVHCPRCLAHWNEKRLTCSHCGNENHETINFITIEGDATGQIQVCDECHGYTKVIDSRQFIAKQSPALLDLNTLHLDFVAQENGYSPVGGKKLAN